MVSEGLGRPTLSPTGSLATSLLVGAVSARRGWRRVTRLCAQCHERRLRAWSGPSPALIGVPRPSVLLARALVSTSSGVLSAHHCGSCWGDAPLVIALPAAGRDALPEPRPQGDRLCAHRRSTAASRRVHLPGLTSGRWRALPTAGAGSGSRPAPVPPRHRPVDSNHAGLRRPRRSRRDRDAIDDAQAVGASHQAHVRSCRRALPLVVVAAGRSLSRCTKNESRLPSCHGSMA